MPDFWETADGSLQPLLDVLRATLRAGVARNPAEALLFSGGLDTSVLAVLSPPVPAIHVCLGEAGDDLPYAETVARTLGLELIVRRVTVEEALAAIPDVIRIRRSFDPALPNDLAIYFALTEARRRGFRSVMTGDGADELFAGYSYMFSLDLEAYIPWLVGRMHFSANELGAGLGLRVSQPFLDLEVVTLALTIPPALKVRYEDGRQYGKWVLRRAFEADLPPEVCWQAKRPIEVGSGFTALRETVAGLVTESDRKGPVHFISPDHPYYYRIYREVVGRIPPPGPGQKPCPGCGAGMPVWGHHCRICGWVEPYGGQAR